MTTVKCRKSEIIVVGSEGNCGSWTKRIAWDDIKRIVAYKRDIFAYDLICLAVDFGGNNIELNEEMEGWDALLELLPGRLPGVLPSAEWWKIVALPPLATNLTTLFLWRASLPEPIRS